MPQRDHSDGEQVDGVLVDDVREDDQEVHEEGGVELDDGGCMSGVDERDGDQGDHEVLVKDVREGGVHDGGGTGGVELGVVWGYAR